MSSRDYLDLILLGAIWGASFLFMRVAVPQFGPIPLIAVRVGVGAAFLIAVIGARADARRSLARNTTQLAVLGAINSAIPFTLFAYAVVSVTAGFAAVLNSTAPLFGALVAFAWLGEAPSRSRVLGLVVGFTGVVILVWGRLSFAADGAAVLAGLTAAFLYGIAANYTKRHLSGVDPLVIAAGSLIGATVFLAPLAVLYRPPITPNTTSWVSAALLGIVCTGVAYILYFKLLKRVGPSRTLTVTYLIPAFGVWWGYVFLGETITGSMIAGCAVILVGIGLTTGALAPQRRFPEQD